MKTKIIILILSALIFTRYSYSQVSINIDGSPPNSSAWSELAVISATNYIGENYGGGIVFYKYDGGQHGLIAATADQNTGIRWYGGANTNTCARIDLLA